MAGVVMTGQAPNTPLCKDILACVLVRSGWSNTQSPESRSREGAVHITMELALRELVFGMGLGRAKLH
ncbi:predicted protein [Plenodomus lingam JN3]|uniref:Predicted protein n=1 Tax=Leptosphaeria maculans (strain JN3 / isolate v23.1.3 / race Av1-4-5-6-7-8) TaxID=985895 RepID=E5ABK3_LEPMJ|nr:predicted protein [Plenodomus lingam JN3]CBY01044.1 predicted protein [Plenodomus lingam JN3]